MQQVQQQQQEELQQLPPTHPRDRLIRDSLLALEEPTMMDRGCTDTPDLALMMVSPSLKINITINPNPINPFQLRQQTLETKP